MQQLIAAVITAFSLEMRALGYQEILQFDILSVLVLMQVEMSKVSVLLSLNCKYILADDFSYQLTSLGIV